MQATSSRTPTGQTAQTVRGQELYHDFDPDR